MSRRKRRREVELVGLSFLDVICCGFGAVILLLVLVKFAEPVLLEQTTEELEAIIQSLEEEIEEIRGETRIVNQELVAQGAALGGRTPGSEASGGSLAHSGRVLRLGSGLCGLEHYRGTAGPGPTATYRGDETPAGGPPASDPGAADCCRHTRRQ
jgi:hypothetical protein